MAFWITQTRLYSDSGLPSDTITNTMHWESSGAASNLADTAEIAGALQDFYEAIEGGFPTALITPDFDTVFYDLEDPEPRVPVVTIAGVLTLTATNPLPSEVAACLSYYGLFESGIPNARRRGRIYIGPNSLASTEVVAGRVQWTAARLNTWKTAMQALAQFSGTTHGAHLVTYSPTIRQTGTLVEATSSVEGGWVDNAPDTQRRRGTDPTTRVTWTT